MAVTSVNCEYGTAGTWAQLTTFIDYNPDINLASVH